MVPAQWHGFSPEHRARLTGMLPPTTQTKDAQDAHLQDTAQNCACCALVNRMSQHFCHQCGHAAHLPRMQCDCYWCNNPQ